MPKGHTRSAIHTNQRSQRRRCGMDCKDTSEAHVVTISDGTSWVVRRITPTECERLQGFPDGWTDIGDWVDSSGKTRKTTDGNRYKALGNSFAVPVVRWLGERIEQVNEGRTYGAAAL